MLPDHPYPFQGLREQVRDLFRLGLFELLAGLREALEEDEVVRGLLRLALDVGSQLSEALCVIALVLLQEPDYPFQLFVLELLVNVFQVLPPVPPVLNLVQRA